MHCPPKAEVVSSNLAGSASSLFTRVYACPSSIVQTAIFKHLLSTTVHPCLRMCTSMSKYLWGRLWGSYLIRCRVIM